jgi:hypothetical protein
LLLQRHFHPFLKPESSTSYTFLARGNYVFVFVFARHDLIHRLHSADPTEKSWTFFGKIKGRTESQLLSLPSTPAYSALRVFNVRPGLVIPEEHHRPQTVSNKLAIGILEPVLKTLVPSQVSPTGPLSKVLVDLATSDGNALQGDKGSGIEASGRTVRSPAIRRLAEL